MKFILFFFIFMSAGHILSAQCNPDKTPPKLVPKANIQVALGGQKCVTTVKPEQFLTSITDNCAPLSKIKLAARKAGAGWGFPMPSHPLVLSAADMGAPVIVEVWARDSSGNTTFVYSSVSITNPAGCVFQLLPDTICTLTEQYWHEELNWQIEVIFPHPPSSDFEENYCMRLSANLLDGPFAGYRYRVTPQKDNDPLNGVSTYDLVLLQQHILEWKILENPYQIIAADADRSGSITLKDVIELRKLILGIYTSLPDNTSWRFIPGDHKFPYPKNPFYTVIPESVEFDNNLKTPLPDMVAIKVGDVNFNAISSHLIVGQNRAPAALRAQDQKLSAGAQYVIPIFLDGIPEPVGLQFALRFDPAVLEITDVLPGAFQDISEDHYFQPEPGLLTVSWLNLESASTGGEIPVFYLNIRASRETTLQEVLALAPEHLAAEVYTAEGAPGQLSLNFLALPLPGKNSVAAAFPNPGNGEVLIPVELARDAVVRIEVITPDGRILYSAQQTIVAGRRQLSLPANTLGNYTGVLAYKLWVDDALYQGKLLRI